MRATQNKAMGFSLTEMLIAVALGLIILGSTMRLFKTGMDATLLVTQQSDTQQNVRAALNLIAKDISMAGSGLPTGGLSLPNGGGAKASMFAVDTNRAWLATDTYPTGTISGVTVTNYMFGIIPGPKSGMEAGGPNTIAATGQTPDAITVIYQDYSFPLNQYTVTFANPNGTAINLQAPANPPAGFPAILSPGGIQVGDLILLSNPTGYAVGEVNGITNGGGTINFNDGDPLNMNQSGATKGNIKYIASGANPIANRIWAITYFIEVPANGQPPRLMRQVNGQTPAPISDNIIGLQFTYDMCDGTNGPNCSGVADPILGGFSPNQIRKVDIQIMGQSLVSYGNKSRSIALATSVSTRSLAFKDRYQ